MPFNHIAVLGAGAWGTALANASNQYLFRVANDANKIEIGQAVEKIFGVKVTSVRVMNRLGKIKRRGVIGGRRPGWKRAVVRLKKGDSINLA